jgi:peptide deformylase
MSILKIARIGHPVLRRVADPVPPGRLLEPDVQRLIDDMLETVREYEGVGLAAPQVHVPQRLFVLVFDGQEDIVLANPEVTFLTTSRIRSFEGCLSVPHLRASVDRFAKVRVEGFDRKGGRLVIEMEGFPAIAVQHECDHLDGIVFLDRCNPRTICHVDEMRRFGPPDPALRETSVVMVDDQADEVAWTDASSDQEVPDTAPVENIGQTLGGGRVSAPANPNEQGPALELDGEDDFDDALDDEDMLEDGPDADSNPDGDQDGANDVDDVTDAPGVAQVESDDPDDQTGGPGGPSVAEA